MFNKAQFILYLAKLCGFDEQSAMQMADEAFRNRYKLNASDPDEYENIYLVGARRNNEGKLAELLYGYSDPRNAANAAAYAADPTGYWLKNRSEWFDKDGQYRDQAGYSRMNLINPNPDDPDLTFRYTQLPARGGQTIRSKRGAYDDYTSSPVSNIYGNIDFTNPNSQYSGLGWTSFNEDEVNDILASLAEYSSSQPANATASNAYGGLQRNLYSRGGQMKTRVPKYLRDEYGRKLVRVPGWGDDDTDVYF